jgi:hypothetical protein
MLGMRLLRTITDNPILLRELRRRMRGRMLVFSIILYVSALCGVAYVIMLFMTRDIVFTTAGVSQQLINDLSEIGRVLFYAMLGIQGLLVIIVAPVLTAGTVTMEREKKTFEFLQVTTIKPGTFVLGNLMSTGFYVLLVMICSLPIMSLVFLYGGVSPGDVLKAFGIMLLASATLSSIGMFISSTRERTRGAIGGMLGILFIIYIIGGSGGAALVARMRGGPSLGGLLRMFPSNVYGVHISPWIIAVGFCVLIILGFVIVAARKVYDTRNRSFSFLQTLIVFLVILFILMGFMWRNLNNDSLTLFLFVTTAIIVAMIVNCSIGERRIGDEQWRLKKKYPSLRKVDEGFWFPVILLMIWLASFGLWYLVSTKMTLRLINYLPSILVAFLAFFVFAITASRLISLYISDRRAAARLTITLVIVVLGVLPAVAHTLISLRMHIDMPEWPLLIAKRLSPAAVAIDYMSAVITPGSVPRSDVLGLPAGYFTTLLYFLGAIAVAKLNATLRKKKVKLPEYYYKI